MKRALLMAAAVGYLATTAWVLHAQQPKGDGPQYGAANSLVRPAYRHWVFLSSGIDMAYPTPGAAPAPQALPQRHQFTNVFVNPSSYDAFLKTGTWANGTVFVLEARRADAVSKYFPLNQNGQYQTESATIEANVKDSRFPDGWAFYSFNGDAASAEPLAGAALARGQCVECHTEHTAVERTFVQFYPTLMPVAREKHTIKPGFEQ